MGFEMRKKGKFERVEEFTKRMKEVHEEAKAVLRKSQEEMRKYTDKKRSEPEEYKVGDWVLLSTKDLKFQMQRRYSEKLTEQFVGPYKVKRIISTNAIELELPSTIKIHPVVNVSRVHMYRDQVEDQRKEQPLPVVIKGEEHEVEKILNKKKFREKDRYLVHWKEYTTEEDTWEPRENLENTKDLVEKFEEKYGKESRQTRKENHKEFYRGELPEKYMAKILYRWNNKRFDQEYWRQLERNWRHWKREQQKKRKTLEMIQEEQEQEQEMVGPRIEE